MASPSTPPSVEDQLASLEQFAAEGASRPSWCADQLNITAIARDPVQWNKDWERTLRRMYAESSANVYDKAVEHWRSALSASFEREMRDRVLKIQRSLRTSVFKNPSFVIMWLLLSGTERERHALNGLRFSLSSTVWGQDARMLCPDVTTSSFLKCAGQMFTCLLEPFRASDRVADDILFLDSQRWSAIATHLHSVGEAETMYDRLSLVRNEFIATVAKHVITSVLLEFDSSHASESMAAARRLMTGNMLLAMFVTLGGASFRERPVVRCQRCELCAEELRIHPQTFKKCSKCREQLGVHVFYCSPKCQSADWLRHKPKCGRQRVAPPPGSAVDALRSCFNAAEIVQTLTQGNLTLSSIGLDIRHTPRSAALRRQILQLEARPDVDYVLFHPSGMGLTSWMLTDMEDRLVFRLLRREATSSEEGRGADALADVVVRCVSAERHPLLTREVVLNQLCAEYGEDLRVRLRKFERTWGGDPEFSCRMMRWPWHGPEDDEYMRQADAEKRAMPLRRV